MPDIPNFLIQHEPRLSNLEAEKTVDALLSRLNISISQKGKSRQYIIKNQGTDKEEKIKYLELVQDVRKHGLCSFLQTDLDRSDAVFAGTFGMTLPNWQTDLIIEWTGYKKELKGPYTNVPSEINHLCGFNCLDLLISIALNAGLFGFIAIDLLSFGVGCFDFPINKKFREENYKNNGT